MKKLISLVLALVLCVGAMPVMAFADTTSTDGLFGVIVDADGNIAERIPMSRSVYKNEVYTLQPGYTYISYQYEPTESFLFGFSTKDTNGNYITTSNPSLRLIVEGANEIGASPRNECINKLITINSSQKTKGLVEYTNNVTSYKYFNGKLINESSVPATIRIIIALNFSTNDWDKIGEL